MDARIEKLFELNTTALILKELGAARIRCWSALGKTSLLRFIVSFYSPDHDNTNNVMVFGVLIDPRSSFLT